MKVSFDLSDNDLKHFRRIMREVRAKCSSKPESEIISAARGLIAEVAVSEAPDFVRQRVDSLSLLIDMLEDDEWALTGRDRERVLQGMCYFAEPDDMIPDKVPVLGYLDDAIMVELVSTELVHEIEAYRDFCEFREKRESVHGTDEDPHSRNEWVVSRRKQLHARLRRRRSRRRGRASGSGGSNIVSLW